MTAFV